MTHSGIIIQLEQAFEDERRYLLQGDLTRLARLARRKESLLSALNTASLSKEILHRFAELSARNQSLIAAAQAGLKSAKTRLSDLHRGIPASTYSASGAKSELSKPVRTLQRRA